MTALRRAVVSQAGPGSVDRVDAAGAAGMTEVARLAAGRYGISPGCRLHLYPLTGNWTFRIEAGAAALAARAAVFYDLGVPNDRVRPRCGRGWPAGVQPS